MVAKLSEEELARLRKQHNVVIGDERKYNPPRNTKGNPVPQWVMELLK